MGLKLNKNIGFELFYRQLLSLLGRIQRYFLNYANFLELVKVAIKYDQIANRICI